MSSGQFRSGAIVGEPDSDSEGPGGRYYLRVGPRQIPLHVSGTLIGRDDSCHVTLNGALVSRRHARVSLVDGELYVEDLESTNGTFVNQAKIRGRVPIQPGDRIFVGSFEIEVTWQQGEAPESGTFVEDSGDRETPSSGVAIVGRVAIARERDHWGGVTARGPKMGAIDLETIESAARLAERMFALGRPLAGREILREPLSDLLAMSRRGLTIEPRVLDVAGRSAIKLAQEICDATWLNLAIEIHLLAGQPMRAETLKQIIALREKGPIGDDDLIERYHARMLATLEFMPLAERLLYTELAGLVPGSDDDS
jgi:pSer/pThr/pTyr-binding forkhead associated (FHA) protein